MVGEPVERASGLNARIASARASIDVECAVGAGIEHFLSFPGSGCSAAAVASPMGPIKAIAPTTLRDSLPTLSPPIISDRAMRSTVYPTGRKAMPTAAASTPQCAMQHMGIGAAGLRQRQGLSHPPQAESPLDTRHLGVDHRQTVSIAVCRRAAVAQHLLVDA